MVYIVRRHGERELAVRERGVAELVILDSLVRAMEECRAFRAWPAWDMSDRLEHVTDCEEAAAVGRPAPPPRLPFCQAAALQRAPEWFKRRYRAARQRVLGMLPQQHAKADAVRELVAGRARTNDPWQGDLNEALKFQEKDAGPWPV